MTAQLSWNAEMRMGTHTAVDIMAGYNGTVKEVFPQLSLGSLIT